MPDMIGSFASSTTSFLVAKNENKKLSQLFDDRFSCSRCLNNCIKVSEIIGSFVCGTTASLVAKMELKRLFYTLAILKATGLKFGILSNYPQIY